MGIILRMLPTSFLAYNIFQYFFKRYNNIFIIENFSIKAYVLLFHNIVVRKKCESNCILYLIRIFGLEIRNSEFYENSMLL